MKQSRLNKDIASVDDNNYSESLKGSHRNLYKDSINMN